MKPDSTASLALEPIEPGDAAKARADLLEACFDLLNDDISGPQWNAQLAELAGCRNACCVWWRAGQPDQFLMDSSGTEPKLSADLLEQLDKLIAYLDPTMHGFIDQLAKQAGVQLRDPIKQFLTPDKLVICIDWDPARVIFILSDPIQTPDWQAADRLRLTAALPVIRKSLNIKKRLSRNEDIQELSDRVTNSYAHGVATLTSDGEIITFNQNARDFIAAGHHMRLRGNQLQLQDRNQQSEFSAQLQNLRQLAADELHAFSWHCNLGDQDQADHLLMTMKATSMPKWRMESSSDNRVVVITLDKMNLPTVIDKQQLSSYYGLSKAEARLAGALLLLESIEAAADTCNISKHTARSHLRSIYAKVGVDSLSKLMLRLGKNSARMTGNIS